MITPSPLCSSLTTVSSVLLAVTLLLGRWPVLKSRMRHCHVQPAPGGTTKAAAHGGRRASEKTLKDRDAKETEKAQKAEGANEAERFKMMSAKRHKGWAPTALPMLPSTHAAGMAHGSHPGTPFQRQLAQGSRSCGWAGCCPGGVGHGRLLLIYATSFTVVQMIQIVGLFTSTEIY